MNGILIALGVIVAVVYVVLVFLNTAGPPRRATVHDGIVYQIKLESRLARAVDKISPGTLKEIVIGRCIHAPGPVLSPASHAHGFGHVRQVVKREHGSRFRGMLALCLEHPYKGLLALLRGGHFYGPDHPLEAPVIVYEKANAWQFLAAVLDPASCTIALVKWEMTEPLIQHYIDAGVIPRPR